MNVEPDVKARITLTGRDFIGNGCRPIHRIGDYLTTGLHQYINCDILRKNESVEGTITFITSEAYPHSLKVGMRIEFQDGSQIIGYADVLEIYNDVLAEG